MSEVIEIRCSSIPSYNDCPRRAAASLFKEKLARDGFVLQPSRSSCAAAIGTAVHKGVAELLRSKQAMGEFVAAEVERAAMKALGSFHDETKEGVIWDKTTPHGLTAEVQLKALLYSFVPILDTITPTHIELPLTKLVSPLGDQAGFKIMLTGTLDVRDDVKIIHDHKTGASAPSPQAQGGGYIALCRLNDIEVNGFRVNFSKREGIQKSSIGLPPPTVMMFDPEECLSACWSTLAEIQRHYEAYAESVERGNPDPWSFPANPMSMICTPKYCRAFKTGFCSMGGCDAEE